MKFRQVSLILTDAPGCRLLLRDFLKIKKISGGGASQRAAHRSRDVHTLNKAKEMGQILDNIWSDKKIRQDKKMYSWGISIACGAIGYSVGGLVPGFLATLGMKGLEKSNYIETFSELIAKKVASPSLATVYDFQKKYRLDT